MQQAPKVAGKTRSTPAPTALASAATSPLEWQSDDPPPAIDRFAYTQPMQTNSNERRGGQGGKRKVRWPPGARLSVPRLFASLFLLLVGSCRTTTPDTTPPRPADPAIAHLARLPEPCLKQLYIRCSREASQRLLDFGTAAYCSTVYETLLKGSFGGDFQAFLAWSRQHPDDAPIGDLDADACVTGGAAAPGR